MSVRDTFKSTFILFMWTHLYLVSVPVLKGSGQFDTFQSLTHFIVFPSNLKHPQLKKNDIFPPDEITYKGG